jgi:hypothetical protein
MLVVMQICNGHMVKDIRVRKNPTKFDAAACSSICAEQWPFCSTLNQSELHAYNVIDFGMWVLFWVTSSISESSFCRLTSLSD